MAVRGLVISPVLDEPAAAPRGTAAAVAFAPVGVMPTLSAAPASSSAIDWRAVFGASAVRAVLAAWPGAVLTSYLRTPARNAAVGGRVGSYHLVGLAADFVVPRTDRARFVAWVRATWPAGVDVVDEGDHIHIEWEDWAVTPLASMLLAGGLVLAGVLLFSR